MRNLILLVLLMLSVTVLGTSEADKDAARSKLDAMDNLSDESFDAETDEEALQKLKKKAADKRKESDKKKEEEGKEEEIIKRDPIEKDTGLKDTYVDEDNSRNDDDTETVYVDGANPDDFNDNEDEESSSNSKMIITLGGGYSGSFDYHPSEHFGIEFLFYPNPKSGASTTTGITLGLGIVNLDDYDDEPYLSLALSGVMNLISPDWGPFLRGDLGVMAWWEPVDDNDDTIIEDDEDDTEVTMLGIIAKAGAGFTLGSKNGGLNIQLLYTIHATTSGSNDGVELQIGFVF